MKTTGFCTSPFANSCAGIVVFADANTSAGAPSVIWAASVFDAANEYFGPASIFGKTSVSDAAAYTVMPLTLLDPCLPALAAAPPTTSNDASSAQSDSDSHFGSSTLFPSARP